MRYVFSILLMSALLPRALPQDNEAKQPLQGSWEVVSEKKNGKPLPDPRKGAFTFSFSGDRGVFKTDDKSEAFPFRYTVNPKAKPREMDLVMGDDKYRAIYQLDGNTMRLCFVDEKTSERPKAFDAKMGRDMLLKRVMAPAPQLAEAGAGGENAKKELETLRGVWAVEAIEHHGSPILLGTKVEGKGEVLFTGDKMTLAHFHAPELPKGEEYYQPEFTVTLTPSGSPTAIDLLARNGPRKGKTARGIYQLEGNVLKLCLAMEDGPRPGKFPGRAPEPKLEVILPAGHAGWVTSLALSGDGKLLVVGTEDRAAIVWDTAAGKTVQTSEWSGEVTSVGLSSDAKLAAMGTKNDRAILWETASGKVLRTFQGHTHHFVASVALSGDGKRLVTAGPFDPTAILWDAVTGKKLQTFKGPAGGVTSMALSPDGKYVVTGSSDGTSIVWEAATGKKLQALKGHTGRGVVGIALSGDGKRVVTGADDGTAILWETDTGKKLKTFPRHRGGVGSVFLSADATRVVTGSFDDSAILWEAATGKKLQTFQGHTSGVRGVALSPDGKQLWTGSADGTARLWDAGSSKELCALLSLGREKDWLVVTPDGLFDGSKAAWKHVTYRAAGTRAVIDDDATRRTFHRPGLLAQLVKGEKPKPPAGFDARKGPDLLVLTLKRDIHTLEGGHPTVFSNVAFSPDGKTLASCELDENGPGDAAVVKLWDVARRKVIATLAGPTRRLSSVAFSPDGKTLAAGGRNKDDATAVRLWDVASGKEKAALKSPTGDFCPVAFSPDGKVLASGGDQAGETGTTGGRTDHPGVKLWDLSAGKEKASLKGHAGPVFTVAFSPDGTLLASGGGIFASNGQSGPGEVKLWEVATGRAKVTLKGQGLVWSVAFSPDGKTLATGDVFGNVLLWDVPGGKRTATLQKFDRRGGEANSNPAFSVTFSPDGKMLAAATARGIKLWDVKSGKSVETPMGPSATIWSVAISPDGMSAASAGSRRVIGERGRMGDDPTLRLWELRLPK